MRSSIPIFHAGSATPRVEGPGLSIAGIVEPCSSPAEAWIHGVLLAPEDQESRETWMRSLFVSAVREESQGAGIVGLLRGATLLREPSSSREIPFSFNFVEALKLAPTPGAYHVHVSARQYSSTVIRVVFAESGAPAPTSPGTPIDNLVLAHTQCSAGSFTEAIPHFAAALSSPALAADLERPTLHNAACAATRAARTAAGEDREALLQRGLGWAEEGLREARALESQLGAPDDAARLSALQQLIAATLTHDPDLAELRAHPAWEARVLRGVS